MTCAMCGRSHWVWELDDPDWVCPCGGTELWMNDVERMWAISPPLARVAMVVLVAAVCAAVSCELIYSFVKTVN